MIGRLLDRITPRRTDPDIPVLIGLIYPDAATLEAMHEDCIVVVYSKDEDDRLEALARLLPHMARGMDLAGMLGMIEP